MKRESTRKEIVMYKTAWRYLKFIGMSLFATGLGAQGIPDISLNPPNAFTTFQINFSDPGARSMGMGGAFVALANDATAAVANPAGLTQIVTPESSAEARYWSFTTPFTAGGIVPFDGAPPELDIDESTEHVSDLSFFSFVYPKNRWSLALYRSQFLAAQGSAETRGLFGQEPTGGLIPVPTIRSVLDIDVVSYGFSAAYRFTTKLSLGVGLSYFQGESRSGMDVFVPFAPEPFREEDLIARVVLASEDSDWGIAAGALWQFSRHWNLGLSFREGPEFNLTLDTFSGPSSGIPVALLARYSTAIRFPDIFGLGLAFRSVNDVLYFSFEWDYVEYTAMIESLRRGSFESCLGDCPGPVYDDRELEDGSEFHVGLEYVFFQTPRWRLACRAGAWLDPDHRVRSTNVSPIDRAFFQPGEDELHYTAGFGFAFGALEIDIGIDFSELVDVAAFSTIYKF